MTEPTPISPTGSRDALRARIEAAERRNADRTLADQAREAAAAAVDYTRANPLTVIGGALAAGLIIGLLTRPGRRVASRVAHSTADAISGAASSASSGVKNVASRGGSRFGQMTLIDEVLETARAGQERAEELSDAAGVKAKKITARTTDAAGSAAHSTRALARKTRAAAADIVRDLGRKTKG